MSGVISPKFSREELIEIVRRHVHAYKDDEQFAQSMIDMAAFLVEYRAYKRRNMPRFPGMDETPTGEQRRRWLRATEDRDEELKDVLQKYSRERPANCRLCGAPTEGRAMCPNCGNITT